MPQPSANVSCVPCRGESLTAGSVDEMCAAVDAALQSGAECVVVDLQPLQRAELPGVAALLRWAAAPALRDRGVVFAGARGDVLRAVVRTRLALDVDFYNDRQAALDALETG